MSEQPNNRPSKRSRIEVRSNPQIPHFDFAASSDKHSFLEAFHIYQVAHLVNLTHPTNTNASNKSGTTTLSWKEIKALYTELNQQDRDSWCIETKAVGGETPSSDDFLDPAKDHPQLAAYCSFLIQKDKAAYTKLVAKLPVRTLDCAPDFDHEACIWMFFGRNDSCGNMQGRPEHTDSISHDGTWHYQLSGSKKWLLRPTSKLVEHIEKHAAGSEAQCWTSDVRLTVECKEGDVIVVNTRLWRHQTVIPKQSTCSVSYARDFWSSKRTEAATTIAAAAEGISMTNVDGVYAMNDIEAGVVIFTEHDMPNGELHRSKEANCEVVELEDGTNAVISSRAIQCGDFFCIPESSDDESCSDDGDGDEEDDDDDDNDNV